MLTLLAPPTAPQQTVDVLQGSQILLRCLRPQDAVSIRWSRENNVLLPRQSYLELDNLVIPRIQYADGGIYKCTAYLSNGRSIVTPALVNVIREC